ncbi:hypothetical protein [Clostridium sp. chh4-2]|nr:hypothetical protein [Clostridium sp. chh4-2]
MEYYNAGIRLIPEFQILHNNGVDGELTNDNSMAAIRAFML